MKLFSQVDVDALRHPRFKQAGPFGVLVFLVLDAHHRSNPNHGTIPAAWSSPEAVQLQAAAVLTVKQAARGLRGLVEAGFIAINPDGSVRLLYDYVARGHRDRPPMTAQERKARQREREAAERAREVPNSDDAEVEAELVGSGVTIGHAASREVTPVTAGCTLTSPPSVPVRSRSTVPRAQADAARLPADGPPLRSRSGSGVCECVDPCSCLSPDGSSATADVRTRENRATAIDAITRRAASVSTRWKSSRRPAQ